jgi:antagonist of KipI
MALEVIDAGNLVTVQDLGRFGFQHFGMPVSGPTDYFSHYAANILVGNSKDAATIEIGLGGLEVITLEEVCIAVCGKGFYLIIDGCIAPLWTSVFLEKDSKLRIDSDGRGSWSYLGVAGGINVPPVLGSKATLVRGRMGGYQGRNITAGDVLILGEIMGNPRANTGRYMPSQIRPAYSMDPVIEVILGPQVEQFTSKAITHLLTEAYEITVKSDRMGYHLQGAPLDHLSSADILSDGLVMGAIQVPSNGQPIIMMADCPTTGGYTKLACVVRADLPLLAQCPMGSGIVRFRETTVTQAQARFREQIRNLEQRILVNDDDQDMDWVGAVQ